MKHANKIIAIAIMTLIFGSAQVSASSLARAVEPLAPAHNPSSSNCSYIWMEARTASSVRNAFWANERKLTISAVTSVFLGSKYNANSCSRKKLPANQVNLIKHKAGLEMANGFRGKALITLYNIRYNNPGILDTQIKKIRFTQSTLGCVRSTHSTRVKVSGSTWRNFNVDLLEGPRC